MGLDVYVGSLTRYYCGDWETIVQQWARETGAEVQMVRLNDPADAITDPAVVRPAVLQWRENLQRSLSKHLPEALDWDESPDAPYFADKPGWEGYGALLLLAAYAEHPHLHPPPVLPESWEDDPVLLSMQTAEARSRYGSLFNAVIWFPVDLSFTFKAPNINGDRLRMGSSRKLLSALEDLNATTFRGSLEDRARWRQEGAGPSNGPLEQAARFGLAILWDLAEKSVAHRLPMLLDY